LFVDFNFVFGEGEKALLLPQPSLESRVLSGRGDLREEGREEGREGGL